MNIKGSGCVTLIISGLIGGWALQYDINHLAPILHNLFPGTISNPGPIHMSFMLWIFGLFLGGPAIVVAIWIFFFVFFGIIH